MKKIICIQILAFTIFTSLFAQKTFSKILREGYRGAAFINAFIEKDTIFATGTVIDSTWGAWFVKMDTTGKVLLEKQYKMKPFPEFFVSDNSWGFIKTTDGGYAMLGVTYFIQNEVLIKIKSNGDLEFIKYYPYKGIDYSNMWDIVEINNGYLISTLRHYLGDGLKSVFTTIDKKGEFVKDTIFPISEGFGSFTIKNKDTIMTTGSINGRKTPAIRYFDYDGNVLGTKLLSADYGLHLFKMIKADKGWIGTSYKSYDNPTMEPPLRDTWINGMDDNFKLLWQKRIGYKGRYYSGNYISPLNYDEYVALQYQKGSHEFPQVSSYNGAFIQKFNGKGDLLWNRLDTVFWAGSECINNYVSALPLPSGNIMVLGWTQKCYGNIEERGAYAWVVKLSKDGCLLEPICGISSTGENFDIQQFRAFPNPASSSVTIEWKVANESTWNLVLRDYSGRVVEQKEVDTGNLRYTMDIENLANGLYFYELRAANGQRVNSGKVLIQR